MALARWRLSLASVVLLFIALGCATLIRFPDHDEEIRFVPYNPKSDLLFRHETHEDECVSCHRGLSEDVETVEEVKDTTQLMIPAKDACFACHPRGEDCAKCHKTLRRKAAPPSHTVSFVRHHDRAARARTSRCDWCHGRGVESCQDCHSRMRPADHGLRWKNSLHGRAAVHDRKKCFVCHQSVSCARCHSQPPEYHTAAFRQGAHRTLARRKLRTCFACHDYQKTCAQCHN